MVKTRSAPAMADWIMLNWEASSLTGRPNCREYIMKVMMTPTVMPPPSASQPPAATTSRNDRLLTRFIEGPIRPPSVSARMPMPRRRPEIALNAASVCGSRQKACTARWPVIISSARPLSSPMVFWRSRKSLRDTRTMRRPTTSESGSVTQATTVIRQLIQTMKAKVPTSVTIVPMNCSTPGPRVLATMSMSFVSRLMNSPCVIESKRATGSDCTWLKSILRMSRTEWFERIVVP